MPREHPANRPPLGPADCRLLVFRLRTGKLDPGRTAAVEAAPDGSSIERLEASGTMTEDAVATTLHERRRVPVLDLTAVEMVNRILEEALRCGTSDVHVDPPPGQVNVRFRVNGVLEHALEMPRRLPWPVAARLEVMANLDVSERRVPQDGRLSDPGGARCPQCAHPAEQAFSSYPMCGASLRRECPSCRKVLEDEWARCPYCSHKLARAEGTEATEGAADPVRILVVDDDADTRFLVRSALGREAIPNEIDEATGGREALAMIEEKRPSLVILDLMMPEMDGYEVCRHLRSDLRTALIPVLMMTAQAEGESRRLGYEAGTDDYVTKPFDAGELRTRVRWLLDLQRQPGATGSSARLRGADPPSAAKPQATPVVREPLPGGRTGS